MRIAILTASVMGFVLVAGVGLVQGAAGPPSATVARDPVPAMMKSPADIAQGRAFFTGVCAAYCHKMTPVHNDAPYLFGCDFKHGGANLQMFHTITHGIPGTRMVSFKDAIADQDLWRIIAYLKSASQCKSQAGAAGK